MALSFAHPELAVGALLALLPLAIHLFNRQRARPRPFGAIAFLMRSKRQTARALRLRKILLFCARTMLLLAVPLALARPHFVQPTESAQAKGPTATAIAIDTSLSMRAVDGGRTRFERAQALALDALREVPIGDPVAVIDCASDAGDAVTPGFDREASRRAIESMSPTHAFEDLSACLSRATQALAASPLPNKRVLLATDLAQAGFDLGAPAPTVQLPDGTVTKPALILLDAADGDAPLANAAIADLDIEPVPALGRATWRFSVTVQNNGEGALSDLGVRLRVDGEVVAKGFLDIPPRQKAVQIFTHRFDKSGGGAIQGSAEIDSDALAADDIHHFTLDIPREVRALVVNGSPHPNRFLDETFFVRAALDAPGSPVRTIPRELDALTPEDLSACDLVILANVRALSPAQVSALSSFVDRGGGLSISLGDQVDADLFNERLGALLPRRLRLLKTAVHPKAQSPKRRAARLGSLDLSHPALSPFAAEDGESLMAAHFFSYFLLEAEGQPTGRTLASFDDGAPALIERKQGQGRVMLFTSSLDRAWSDLPIRAAFLPLMQRLMGSLSRTLEVTQSDSLRVGEVKTFPMPFAERLREVVAPDGERFSFDEPPPPAGVRFSKTNAPGVYEVSGLRQGELTRLRARDFAVNVDPVESDLRRIDVDELKAWFGDENVTRRTAAGTGGRGEDGWPLWSLLLALAFCCFVAECLLLRR